MASTAEPAFSWTNAWASADTLPSSRIRSIRRPSRNTPSVPIAIRCSITGSKALSNCPTASFQSSVPFSTIPIRMWTERIV